MGTPNPKCNLCRCYWKPDETDVKPSGLVAKTCKRCRAYQKERRSDKDGNIKDYSKGKIYVIKSLKSPDVYVGSTINTLEERMIHHRIDYENNIILGKKKDIVKNIDDWSIELYELYPCKNITELRRREGEIIALIGTLNKNIAGRTKEEYCKINEVKLKTDQKIYNANHVEDRKEYSKQYCLRDGVKERKRQNRRDSRAKNKDNNIDLDKEYRKRNPDKIKEYQNEYRIKQKLANLKTDPLL